MSSKDEWREIASKKRQSLLNLIPGEWLIDVNALELQDDTDLSGSFLDSFLSPLEIAITQSGPYQIVETISSGQWQSEQVTRAFAHRAALAHQFLPCLHEINFEDAYIEARRLDEYYHINGEPIGPLHGLPISLKDQFHVRGLDTSMGYVGWLSAFRSKSDAIAENAPESELVRELRALGAIIYCKTAVPQTLMAGETFNNIIGYLWNPRSRKLSSAGSSGGEGVLLSMKGSPLGFGTDLGGSVRVPAMFNGLYGLRTSSGRLPYRGVANSMSGQISAPSTIGPLSPTASGLRLAVTSVLSQEPWLHDAKVHPIPWRQEIVESIRERATLRHGQRLTFGIVFDDKLARPFPAVQRALRVVREKLEAQGHEFIVLDPSLMVRASQEIFKTWFFDGGHDIHRAFALSGEDIDPRIEHLYGSRPRPPMDGIQIAEFNNLHRSLQEEFTDYWMATSKQTTSKMPIDAIICPTATNHGATPLMHVHFTYNLFPNLYDCTACHLPVLHADRGVDVYTLEQTSLGETDDKVRATYDPELFHGMPAGVQIVGRRLEEEKVIAIVEYISGLL